MSLEPSIRLADPEDAGEVTRLLAGFRDWMGNDRPSDDVIATTVGTLVGAGTANANSIDHVFVQVLHERGISHVNGDAVMIDAGHDVCTNLRYGYTVQQQFTSIHNVSQLDWADSGYFVGASIGAYCPEFSSAVT